MKRKSWMICIILAVLTLLCTGCDLSDRDSLFALPELSGEYAHLQKELDKVLAEGASYTVASTGSVRSSVQLSDLDGDGRAEAIGLFLSAEGVPEVHVFRMSDTACTRMGKITGVGIGVREIRYFSRGTQGQKALAVSWAYENEARYYGMTVAGIGGGEVFSMLDLQYNSCLPMDLDEDGVEELTFVRPGKENEAHSACIYQLEGGSYRLLTQTMLCSEAQTVLQMRYDQAIEGQRALVVDSSAVSGGYVTDVMPFDGVQLENLTRDPMTGSGMECWRQIALPSYDIDGDGLLEIPVSQIAEGIPQDKARVTWKDLTKTGETKPLRMAYHKLDEGWGLSWPKNWPVELNAGVFAEFSNRETVTTTVFYTWVADPETEQLRKQTLLTVWGFHGEDRVRIRTQHYLVKPLNETGDILFGFTLPTEDLSADRGLTEAQVRDLFFLVSGSLEGGNE